MESNFIVMSKAQVYLAPVVINIFFMSWPFGSFSSNTQTHLAVQLCFQIFQSVCVLLYIFSPDVDIEEEKESDKTTNCNSFIRRYTMPLAQLLGLIFAIGHICIMAALDDLDSNILLIWFVAYTLIQAIYFLYIVIKAFENNHDDEETSIMLGKWFGKSGQIHSTKVKNSETDRQSIEMTA